MTWKAVPGWVGSAQAFLADDWGRAPRVFRGLRPETPITLGDVDRAIRHRMLRRPHVEMVRGTDEIPESSYTTSRRMTGSTVPAFADGAAIARLLRQGSTLLLRNVEHWHAPTERLTRDFETDLRRPVEAFFFATPAGAQGLVTHRDDADVLLLQISGSKRWTVYPGPGDGNWRPGPAEEVGAAVLEETVRAGDVLYIPRGFAHTASGEEGLSTHLSLTVREVGTQELYAALQRTIMDGLAIEARPLGEPELLETAEQLLDRIRAVVPRLTAADVLSAARGARTPERGRPPSDGDDLSTLLTTG
ncbi:JmjC domain-containing protein [Streptomyces sp. TS71-3]|uniref:JmjC domain-containing protein n=1 Tax=Streptomyces sp. TS71-3 TaxID=2733862 RepID=UPI001B15F451|nr:cupin domain-containing protein [Streptomyces sp. TS71-3]GHJ36114.1 hypothetical protein Sm713_17230 [Streptomyces sp. TS71-3]